MNCELCGASVKVVGKTTMHYKNLDKEKIEKAINVLDELRFGIFHDIETVNELIDEALEVLNGTRKGE